jgi:hypothetical protein
MKEYVYYTVERAEGNELTLKELQTIYDAGWEKWDPEGVMMFDPEQPQSINGKPIIRWFFRKEK